MTQEQLFALMLTIADLRLSVAQRDAEIAQLRAELESTRHTEPEPSPEHTNGTRHPTPSATN